MHTHTHTHIVLMCVAGGYQMVSPVTGGRGVVWCESGLVCESPPGFLFDWEEGGELGGLELRGDI